MEISTLYLAFAILMTLWAIRFLEINWLRPKRIERVLRAQGLKGSPFRFPIGDLKEFVQLLEEAKTKPMPLSHDIAPRVAPLFHQMIMRYGKVSFLWLGKDPTIILTDPDSIRHVLTKKQSIFVKDKPTSLGKLLITGLLAHEGEKWAKHRRIVNPAFQLEKLKDMLPSFSASCDELITKWDRLLGSKEFHELDVLPEFKAFTGDVISRTAFGSSFEKGRRIFQLQQELGKLVVEALVGEAIRYSYIPGYSYLPTKKNKRIKEVNREIDAILSVMIEQREKAIRKGEATSNDLLGILLETNIRDSRAMTTKEVIDECKIFYIAGHDTTTASLTWTLILLSMYPEWQEKARDEVMQVIGKSSPDYDGISRLKIVTMVLNEAIRLYPPVNFNERVTSEEVKLGGITYPAGVHLLLPFLFVQRDPEFWGPDAGEFNPERFAEGISKASLVPGVFLPFSGGPRVCIGQNFSMLEAKLCLARILQHFRFELSPTYAHAPAAIITMQPQYGAQVIIHRI
ncbi:hypothetical protein LUZ60_000642 [Juncus effusus]|nr:hypothetical protein LUZ60_000642 [Juncus effusus]